MARKRTGGKPGNPNGRPSAYEEIRAAKWLEDILDGKIQIKEVEPKQYIIKEKYYEINNKGRQVLKVRNKIVQRFKNGRHALAFHMLTGDTKVLNKVLDKLVASKTDVTTDGDKVAPGGFILMPAKEQD